MKLSVLSGFFVGVMTIGCWLMTCTWGGVVYVYVGEDRSPAAVKSLQDYYPVDGGVLWHAAEEQTFDNANFVQRPDGIGIRLGHFLLRDPMGRRQFACQVQNRPGLYDRVELQFMGVGVSDDGKIPKMTLDSLCNSDDDLAYLNPIWIPMSEIYQSEPKAQQLQFPEIGGTAIHFEDLASQWPNQWSLVRVRFYNSESATPALILEPQAKSRAHVSFNWK